MEQLPPLRKKKGAGYKYAVEVRAVGDKTMDGYIEVFSFSVYWAKDKRIGTLQEGMVVNRRIDKKAGLPFVHYTNILADFYDCKINYEIIEH